MKANSVTRIDKDDNREEVAIYDKVLSAIFTLALFISGHILHWNMYNTKLRKKIMDKIKVSDNKRTCMYEVEEEGEDVTYCVSTLDGRSDVYEGRNDSILDF